MTTLSKVPIADLLNRVRTLDQLYLEAEAAREEFLADPSQKSLYRISKRKWDRYYKFRDSSDCYLSEDQDDVIA